MRTRLLVGELCVWLLSVVAAGAAEPTAAELIAALKSPDETARLSAIDHLGLRGTKAAEAVPALVALLQDPSAAVRAHAARSLGQVGAAAKPAVPALAALITDADEAVRRSAIEAIGHIRPGPAVSVPLFAKVINDADPTVRIRALHALADCGKEAVPFLLEALKNEKAAYWACLVLSELGPEASEAVPALAELLGDKRDEVRREAILALAEIGSAAAPVVPQLVKALASESDRTPATYALGRIGKVPADAEAKIREDINSPDKVLSVVSLWTLARVHPEDKALVRQATERLVEHLKSDDSRARTAAARALAALQPGPEIALPALEKALAGADEQVVRGALDALAGVGPAAVPKLIDALKHENLRPYVAYMLGRIGPAAKAAVDALVKLLDDKNPEVQHEALIALAKIGPEAKAAVPALAKALQEREGPVCYGIAYALGQIGPAAVQAAPALTKALESSDESLALVSAWALAQIQPASAELAAKSVPVLIRGLAEPEAKFRRGAAEALQKLGPLAKPAAPALKRALQDEDEVVRGTAAAALKSLGG